MFLIRLERGKYAYLKYEINNNLLKITHVYTHPDYRRRGIAAKLVEHTINYARERGLKVIPECSYAVYYFKKHGLSSST